MAPLKRENISDKLADIIGRKIIRNELKSGEIIYETQIAKEWGISRSPVRDALHILMQIRLVERTSRGNYQVTVLTIPLIQHLYEITNILYQYAFSNAAVKATSKDLLVMQQHLARLEKSIAENNFELYLSSVSRFAEKVLKIADNPIVEQIALELMPTAERVQWASITYLPDQLRTSVTHLKEGYKMITAGKAENAAKAFENFAHSHKALVMKIIAKKQKLDCVEF